MIELRAAKIPGIGRIAVHYWFVIHQHGQTERWEVWQKPGQNQSSWGHLHKNLLAFDRGVGNGDSWVEASWQGDEAAKFIAVLSRCAKDYPDKYRYHYWPGPNSNTYVQWVLNQVGCEHQLLPQGIGKNHLGWWGWRRSGEVYQFSTPLLGFTLVKPHTLEIHLLHLAIRVQRRPWHCKTFWLID